jgi:tetratricopeptide (TPR) repeat protein
LYLPSAGFCILAALALRAATAGERRWAGLKSQWLGHGAVAALALCLVVSLRAQEWPFRDNVALFARAAKVSPESAQAWGYLGEELMARDQTEEGTAAFRRAQLLEPDGLLNNYRLAAAYYQAEEMALAEFYFQRAIERYRPPEAVSYDYALYRLGLSQYAQDKMTAAEAAFRRAIELHSNAPGYHVALASALKHEGKLEEARLQSELELQIAPDTETAELLRDVNAQLESGPAASAKPQAAPSGTK